MSVPRVAVTAVLAFTSLASSGSDAPVRAQTGSPQPPASVTTQTILPDGTVIMSSGAETRTILPDGSLLINGVRQGNQRPPLNTLNVGLDNAYWDTTQRGPLLAVAPLTVRPAWQQQQQVARRPQVGPDGNLVTIRPPQPPEPQQNGQYRITDISDYFGRRVVRLKGMSVLAPTEMVVLNTKPGKPDYFANMQQSEKLSMLQSTLTEAQWKLLGSEGGLGAGDLTGPQRELFLSYLPDPMIISKMRSVGQNAQQINNEFKPVVLAGAQRGTVRLRVYRTSRFEVPIQGSSSFRYPIDLQPAGMEFAYLNSDSSNNTGETLFGQPIRSTTPSRLKPQQIDFAAPALQAGISLTEIKTVGELVERIRTATRTAIYVDGRAAKLALWVKAGETQTVSAGDALQALCWSLTGAVRYVPESEGKGVFILTQDLEGIGSRMSRINDWFQAANTHAQQSRMTMTDTIRKKEPLKYIPFDAGDPHALDEKTSKTVEEGWKTFQNRFRGTPMKITDLSPAQQEAIRHAMATRDRTTTIYDGEQRDLANDGTVNVTINVRSVLLVPGVGEVRGTPYENTMGSLDTFLPPPTIPGITPPTPPGRPGGAAAAAPAPSRPPLSGIVCVSPTTDDEARAAVRAARDRGLKQVWLVLPVAPGATGGEAATAKAKSMLAAAVAEAGAAKPTLQIVAGVRLFSLPSLPAAPETNAPLSGDDPRDITITGERPIEVAQRRVANFTVSDTDPALPRYQLGKTRDWVVPTAPGLAAHMARRLAEIASVPGLDGLALLDTAPPGYSLPVQNQLFGRQDNQIEVGYTSAFRAAFIRSAGYDPIDLGTSMEIVVGISQRLPFFIEEGAFRWGFAPSSPSSAPVTPNGEWNRYRTEAVTRTLSEMYAPLTEALPRREGGFPVYLQNLDTTSYYNDWFSRWEKKDALPRRTQPGPGGMQNPFQYAKAVSTVSLMELPYRDAPPPFRIEPAATQPAPVLPAVQFGRMATTLLNNNRAEWAGIVLNLSGIPVEKALELLQEINSNK